MGDKVLWQGYTGTFLRNIVDSQVEALIVMLTYRVTAGKLHCA